MKKAIVIIYDGITASMPVVSELINTLSAYQVITNPDVKPEVYTLDDNEIAQAIVAKAVAPQCDANHPSNRYENAVLIVCEPFMDYIKNGDHEAFTIELANAIRSNLSKAANTRFNEAVKIVAEDGSETHLTPAFMYNHNLSSRIIKIIRKTRDIVCQGRHVIIQ